jgi:hypothetical protein
LNKWQSGNIQEDAQNTINESNSRTPGWVKIFGITIIVILVSAQADLVLASSFNINGLQSQLFHAGGGLIVLMVITILSVYKPKGLTRYGQRKQIEQRLESRS